MLPAKASTRRAQDIMISTGDMFSSSCDPGVFRAGRRSSRDGQGIWLMKVKRVETPPLSTTGLAEVLFKPEVAAPITSPISVATVRARTSGPTRPLVPIAIVATRSVPLSASAPF
jgi:hypothetical protein